MQARVRSLHSLERAGEPMRAALNELARRAWEPGWFDRSVHRFEMARFPKQESKQLALRTQGGGEVHCVPPVRKGVFSGGCRTRQTRRSNIGDTSETRQRSGKPTLGAQALREPSPKPSAARGCGVGLLVASGKPTCLISRSLPDCMFSGSWLIFSIKPHFHIPHGLKLCWLVPNG